MNIFHKVFVFLQGIIQYIFTKGYYNKKYMYEKAFFYFYTIKQYDFMRPSARDEAVE